MMVKPPHILVIGAGGLGVSACWGLLAGKPAKMPLKLTIIDKDVIELSNLNRQVLFSQSDIGLSKAQTLRDKLLSDILPLNTKNVELDAINLELSIENIEELFISANLVLDACDSTETKFLINDYCVMKGLPFCYGGVISGFGQIMLVAPRPRVKKLSSETDRDTHGCLRCLFGDFSAQDYRLQTATCQQNGIIGAMAGHVGFLQAEAVLQFLHQDETDKPETCSHLIRVSMPALKPTSTLVEPAADCPLCCGHQNLKCLDLRGKACPTPFLYAKLALETMQTGELLDLRLSKPTSLESVSASLQEEQHRVISSRRISAGEWVLLIEKHG